MVSKVQSNLKRQKNIFNVYKFFDQDNQGYISIENLKKFLPLYGVDVEKADLQKFKELITNDQKKEICLDQFVDFVKKESPPKQSNIQNFDRKSQLKAFKSKLLRPKTTNIDKSVIQYNQTKSKQNQMQKKRFN